MKQPFATTGVRANELALSMLESDRQLPLVIHARVVSGTGGGPEKTILNSPRFLNTLGFDSVCVYFRDPNDEGFDSVAQRAEELEAPLIAVDDNGPFDHRLMDRLRSVLAALPRKQLIWHGHDYKSNLTGLVLRRKQQMHVVTTVHGWVLRTWKTPIYYAIDRWCLKRCDRVICVSTDLYRRCQSLGVSPDKLSMLDNAIDLAQYDRKISVAAAKDALRWPQTRFLVGAVGRLAPEKGFDSLIESVASLIRDGIDVGLVIVGDGPQADVLKQQIVESGYQDRIRLVGFTRTPEAYYQAMDVYALSSLREGLPNVLLEAMAYQIPIVATRIAGVPRLIEHEASGFLVPAGDINAFASALRRVLEEPANASRMGQRGRHTVETRFSFQRRMETMAADYRSTLQVDG